MNASAKPYVLSTIYFDIKCIVADWIYIPTHFPNFICGWTQNSNKRSLLIMAIFGNCSWIVIKMTSFFLSNQNGNWIKNQSAINSAGKAYRISANTFLTFMYCHKRSQYIRPTSKKNSFRGNCSWKYGMSSLPNVSNKIRVLGTFLSLYYLKK